MTLAAPFPWFGGKSRVSDVVWRAFGDVPNYVEPFAGSLAVLLNRPTTPRIETVNDLDCYLANFWRALAAAPREVAEHADWPVNEADLHARHRWLVQQSDFRERMKMEPDYFDTKVAGWWVWGICQWIGTGWCQIGQRRGGNPPQQLPHLGDAGMGIHRKLPRLGDAGRGIETYLSRLAARLRRVRVACGDWTRVLGDSVTSRPARKWRHGVTGVLLDPPYDDGAVDYSAGGRISAEVRAWAIEAGARTDMRVALCGYDGEHDMPASWTVHAWKAMGGYGSQNSARERIWLSPHCLGGERQVDLFGVPAYPDGSTDK